MDPGRESEIMSDYLSVLDRMIVRAFDDRVVASALKGGLFSFDASDVEMVRVVLDFVLPLDGVSVELIGTWVYVFNSKPWRDQLRDMGLWYSVRHKAWVFSGRGVKRAPFRARYKTSELRVRWSVVDGGDL